MAVPEHNSLSMITLSLLFVLAFTTIMADAMDASAREMYRHRKLLRADTKRSVLGQYIIRFDANVTNVGERAKKLLAGSNAQLRRTITSVFKGFVVSNLSMGALLRILDSIDVSTVVQDETVQLNTIQLNTTNWGLDRIDQLSLPRDNKYEYYYTGKGVEAYIMDTGIRTTHTDLKDRITALPRASCAYNYITTENCTDLNGHGTHVAGIVGGIKIGVAKDVTLKALKVLDKSGNGYMSDVISAADFVANQKKSRPNQAMVVNLSLGGGYYQLVNNAVNNLVAAGVVVAVAAGNSNTSACLDSPASAASALTVASSTSNDVRSSFSSWGSCVDLFAPGSSIVSCGISSDTAYVTKSGTSMATPHVVGVSALWLERDASMTPAQVQSAMMASASNNKISDPQGTPNVLLNLGPDLMYAPPTLSPSRGPSSVPSAHPSLAPSRMPSPAPSLMPTTSVKPSLTPSLPPSLFPSTVPSRVPSVFPSQVPSKVPSTAPSAVPSPIPSTVPSRVPSVFPSQVPSKVPSTAPSAVPSLVPSTVPSTRPSSLPSVLPSGGPSVLPTSVPSAVPSHSASPSLIPTTIPSTKPSQSMVPTTAPIKLVGAPGTCPAADACMYRNKKMGFWFHKNTKYFGGQNKCQQACLPVSQLPQRWSQSWSCGRCSSRGTEGDSE